MTQLLLIPDPRPLVDRLGQEFFRQAPASPGVYLMRDAADAVLYVGKAKNLRKRLASYRVANPQRMPRRHLRLLRAVARIELEQCSDEPSALAREAELLRSLRPRFNRAGTWPGPTRFLGWRVNSTGLELVIREAAQPDGIYIGPLGAGALPLRVLLVRLLWCALLPERGLLGMPPGWFDGRFEAVVAIPHPTAAAPEVLLESAALLEQLFGGQPDAFVGWIRERTAAQLQPFVAAVRESDLAALTDFVSKRATLISSQNTALPGLT